jgi:acetate kinase
MSLGRAVIAHLGNGASMAAVHNGQPVDTTMSFTPTGGFMIGTRVGNLDPGLLIYLLTEQNYDADTLGQLLNDQSGLLGVSGISLDLKTFWIGGSTMPMRLKPSICSAISCARPSAR